MNVMLEQLTGLIERARTGNLNAFSALCIRDAHGSPIDLAEFHLVVNAFIDYCWQQNPPLSAGVLAPWRHGKSLLSVIGRAAHAIGLNPEVRIRLICADDREAVLRVAAVRRVIESRRYRRVFPYVRPKHGEWLKHQFTVERSSIGPDPTLAAAGVFAVEAGGGHDIIMFDDLVTYQNTYLAPAIRPAIYDTVTSVWLRRVDPGARICAVGTAWHYDDCNHRLRRQEHLGQWRWLIVRVSDKFDKLEARVE